MIKEAYSFLAKEYPYKFPEKSGASILFEDKNLTFIGDYNIDSMEDYYIKINGDKYHVWMQRETKSQ